IICVAVLVLILVLCLLFGETSTELEDTNVPTATWSTYENSAYGITINYSSDWQKNESIPLNVVTFAYYPEQNTLSSAVLSIMIYDLSSQPMTLEEYTQFSLNQLEQDIFNYDQIEVAATVLAGGPAEKVVYTGEMSQTLLKFMQIWTIKNNKVYLISYVAPAQLYSDSLSTIQKMIDSFEIA
ncbi:MAG: hypothetical protein KKB31_00095, partial [Nanoarchaeota archaeon]|nr:hypothetical protein [Nanoarchaeota archaeon]